MRKVNMRDRRTLTLLLHYIAVKRTRKKIEGLIGKCPMSPSKLFAVVFRPANCCEAGFSGHHHIVVSAGAVDDHDITAAIKAANNADMTVLRVKHKVARLGVAPINRGAVAVLGSGPTAMPNDALSAALVVEHPIHHS